MKFIILVFIFIISQLLIEAQVVMKVVANDKISGYNPGDTVEVQGLRFPNFGGSPEYLIKQKNKEYKSFPAGKFNVVKPVTDFWQKQWFYERSASAIIYGIDPGVRTKLFTECVSFMQNLQLNRFILNDNYLDDYLLQLVHNICPSGLIKANGENDFLKVFVIKSNDQKSISFDNGTIILTTSLLANTKNEQELVKILAREIARIVLDYNYQNVLKQVKSESLGNFLSILTDLANSSIVSNNDNNNQYTFDKAIAVSTSGNLISDNLLETQGAIYNADQDKKANEIADDYISKYYDKLKHKSTDEYNCCISKAITLTAWQNFYALRYKDAFAMILKLGNAGCAEENDYLLMAKIYMEIYNTDESNYEALQFIKTAKKIGVLNLIDLSKQEGLIYLRLNDKAKAALAFEEYKKGLESQTVLNEDDRNELAWVNDVLYKLSKN